jgi:hypothetical protein
MGAPGSFNPCAWSNRGQRKSAETTPKSIPLRMNLPVGNVSEKEDRERKYFLFKNRPNFNFTKLLYPN